MDRFLEARVADFMTSSVVTIAPGATVAEAQRIFAERDFNCLPVVRDDRVVGVLTKLDLLKAFRFREDRVVPPYATIVSEPVRRFMNETVAAVRPDTPLTRVLEQMVKTRFRSVPVVADGRLVGIVSREDVMRALLRAAENDRATTSRSG
jgi:CBS domain-containing protein